MNIKIVFLVINLFIFSPIFSSSRGQYTLFVLPQNKVDFKMDKADIELKNEMMKISGMRQIIESISITRKPIEYYIKNINQLFDVGIPLLIVVIFIADEDEQLIALEVVKKLLLRHADPFYKVISSNNEIIQCMIGCDAFKVAEYKGHDLILKELNSQKEKLLSEILAIRKAKIKGQKEVDTERIANTDLIDQNIKKDVEKKLSKNKRKKSQKKLIKNLIAEIHDAARMGDVGKIEKLIKQGVDKNATLNGRTPLHSATSARQVDSVDKLIELGADLNASTNVNGVTALHLVASNVASDPDQLKKNILIANLLLSNTEKEYLELATKRNGWTALHVAAGHGNLPITMFLIDVGANLHALTSDGKTAYDLAVEYGHESIVKYFESIN